VFGKSKHNVPWGDLTVARARRVPNGLATRVMSLVHNSCTAAKFVDEVEDESNFVGLSSRSVPATNATTRSPSGFRSNERCRERTRSAVQTRFSVCPPRFSEARNIRATVSRIT